MRYVGIIAALGLLLAAPARAQDRADTLSLTLEAALERALQQSEEIHLARAQVRDAGAQVREAMAGALPQINGSLIYTRQFASIFEGLGGDGGGDSSLTDIFKNSPFGAPNSWNAELRASQLLWSGGKVGAGLRAARAFRQGAEAQQHETEADIAYQVKRAYLQVQYAARVLEVAESGLEEARRELRQVQLYQQAGTRAEYDLLRAQVDAANQEPLVVQARNGHDLALLEFKRLVNIPPEQPVVLATPLSDSDGMIPAVLTEDFGAPERQTLAVAEAQVRVREQLVKATAADYWPSLSVSTTYSHQAFPQDVFPFGDQFRRNWNAEVRLSLPIFNGFRTAGQVGRARAALEQAIAERNRIQEQVALDVAQARAELARAQSLLSARRETVRQARRAQHLASVRYANGLANQLEVSDARLLAQRAELNEAQSTLDYLLALAQLERALGRPVPVERRPLHQVVGPSTEQGTKP